MINRCKIYERLYLHPGATAEFDGMLDLQKNIVQAYKSILSFLVYHIKLLDRNVVVRKLVATFKPGQLGEIVADLGRHQARCEMAASNCEGYMSSLSRKRQDAAQKHHQDTLKRHIDNVEANLRRYQELLDDDERCSIFQWISEIPFENDHYIAAKGRVVGTCEWLLDHVKYQEWRESEDSKILWLNGIRKLSRYYVAAEDRLLRIFTR